jgi:hypothetical protein
MPEFRGIKITRAEELARHACRRALVKAVREAAKGTGWRCSGGTLFREQNGWFFDAYPAVTIFWRETQASLRVKPMAIDPIFWDLVNMPENRNQSLSFRGLGAWVCRAPTLEETTINEFDMNPAAAADEFVRWTQETSARVQETLTLENFAKLVDDAQRPGPFNPFLATKIVTKILMGQSEEARRLSVEAERVGDVGGFASDGSLPEMAVRWLDAQRASRIIH